LGEHIFNQLHPEHAARCLRYLKPASAAEVKTLCRELDFILTARMHLAIAALGSGTPAAAFDYHEKFTGLFRWFELPHLVQPGDAALLPTEIADLIKELSRSHTSLRAHIERILPQVKDRARLNFPAK